MFSVGQRVKLQYGGSRDEFLKRDQFCVSLMWDFVNDGQVYTISKIHKEYANKRYGRGRRRSADFLAFSLVGKKNIGNPSSYVWPHWCVTPCDSVVVINNKGVLLKQLKKLLDKVRATVIDSLI